MKKHPAPTAGHSCTLVLNAAEARLQMVLCRHDGLMLFGQDWHAPSRGVEMLAPALHHALTLMADTQTPSDAGVAAPLSDLHNESEPGTRSGSRMHIRSQARLRAGVISRIACVQGPGSFTGIRLVLGTAAGLARATGAAQAPLAYLPLLAANALPLAQAAPPHTPLWVLTHARRNLVHAQAFRADAASCSGVTPLTPLLVSAVSDPETKHDLYAHIRALGGPPPILLGSGHSRNRELLDSGLEQHGLSVLHADPGYDHLSLNTLMQAALHAEYSTHDVEALYARAAEAEDNLPRIAAGLGLDPDLALQRLKQLSSGISY